MKGIEQLKDCQEALEMARAILRGMDVSIRRYLRDDAHDAEKDESFSGSKKTVRRY